MRNIATFLMLLLFVGSLAAKEKAGAVYLFADGAAEDLTNDMTEVLSSKLTDGTDLKIIPKEKFLARTLKLSGRTPEDCLRDATCIKKVGFELNLSLIAIGKLLNPGKGYTLIVTRYSLIGGEDKTFTYDDIPDIPKLIGTFKSLADKLRTAEGAYLLVSSQQSGATVFIDGKFIGVLPLKPVPISEGFHKLMVKKTGFGDYRSKVSCRSGKTCEVKVALKTASSDNSTGLVLKDDKAAGLVSGAVTVKSGSNRPWRIAGYSGLGVGAAVVGTGVYFLMAAKGTSDDLNGGCWDDTGLGKTICSYSESSMRGMVSDGESQMTMAGALIGTGVGLMALSTTAIILFWNDPEAPATSSAMPTIVPTLAPGYGGLSARISF
jgi:PEGA domain